MRKYIEVKIEGCPGIIFIDTISSLHEDQGYTVICTITTDNSLSRLEIISEMSLKKTLALIAKEKGKQ